jgi:multisubunit Na+/H+ antiporter MnhE subunit
MKKTANLITGFLIGFYSSALIIDTDMKIIKIKSIIFTIGILIAFILRIIDDYKTDGHL